MISNFQIDYGTPKKEWSKKGNFKLLLATFGETGGSVFLKRYSLFKIAFIH